MRRVMLSSLGKTRTTSARRFSSLCSAFRAVAAMQLHALLLEEGHVGEHVMLSIIQEAPRLSQRARS